MGELLVIVRADHADDIVEHQNPLDARADGGGLRLEPVDGQCGAKVDELESALRLIHHVHHQLGDTAEK